MPTRLPTTRAAKSLPLRLCDPVAGEPSSPHVSKLRGSCHPMRVARLRGNPTTLCWLARGSWAPNQPLAEDAATLTPAAARLPALASNYFRAPAVTADLLRQSVIGRT